MNIVVYHHRQQRRRRRRRRRRRLLFAFFTKVFDYIFFFFFFAGSVVCVCVWCRGLSEKLMLELEWKRSCAHILCRIAIPFFRASNAFVHMIDFNWFSSRAHTQTDTYAYGVRTGEYSTCTDKRHNNQIENGKRGSAKFNESNEESVGRSSARSFIPYGCPSSPCSIRHRRTLAHAHWGPIGVPMLFIPTSCLFFLARSSAPHRRNEK